MTLMPALLRIALAAVLILNGIGSATASVWMAETLSVAGAIQAASPPAAEPAAGQGCHDHAAPVPQAAPSGSHGHPGEGHADDADCCAPGSACQCACLGPNLGDLPGGIELPAVTIGIQATGTAPPAHIDPVPLQRVRPPIGQVSARA